MKRLHTPYLINNLVLEPNQVICSDLMSIIIVAFTLVYIENSIFPFNNSEGI